MKKRRIVFDAYPLRYVYTGLGQFAYHLVKELAPRTEFDFSFLLHPGSKKTVAVRPDQVLEATWLRRHAMPALQPFVFGDYKLWHVLAENTRFVRFSSSAVVLVTLHGLHFLDNDSPAEARRKLQKLQALVNRADALATVSSFTDTLVRKHLDIGTKPMRIIHHGVEKVSGKSQRPLHMPDGKFLFSIGSFFERKNFQVLLPFIEIMDGFSLVLAGSNSNAYGDFLKNEITQRGLSSRVFLPGEVTDAEKRWLFENCTSFLFPSVSEGFGIPMIEAMLAGKPVFCSEFGSLPEMAGDHAYYWKHFDPGYMKSFFLEKTQHYFADPSLKNRNRSYAASFSWTKAAEDYLAYYSELIK